MTTPVTWEGVSLFTAQWVPGTNCVNYLGPITVELWINDAVGLSTEEAWLEGEAELLERLKKKAEKLGANAVVALDITVNPFAIHPDTETLSVYLRAIGTAAKLEMM